MYTAYFIYEFLITFDSEVELFWKGRFSGATVLFLANRYIFLVEILIGLVGYSESLTPNVSQTRMRSMTGGLCVDLCD